MKEERTKEPTNERTNERKRIARATPTGKTHGVQQKRSIKKNKKKKKREKNFLAPNRRTEAPTYSRVKKYAGVESSHDITHNITFSST